MTVFKLDPPCRIERRRLHRDIADTVRRPGSARRYFSWMIGLDNRRPANGNAPPGSTDGLESVRSRTARMQAAPVRCCSTSYPMSSWESSEARPTQTSCRRMPRSRDRCSQKNKVLEKELPGMAEWQESPSPSPFGAEEGWAAATDSGKRYRPMRRPAEVKAAVDSLLICSLNTEQRVQPAHWRCNRRRLRAVNSSPLNQRKTINQGDQLRAAPAGSDPDAFRDLHGTGESHPISTAGFTESIRVLT